MTHMFRRLKYWLQNTSRSEALREEMELHLAEKAAELEADGLTAEQARAEARGLATWDCIRKSRGRFG